MVEDLPWPWSQSRETRLQRRFDELKSDFYEAIDLAEKLKAELAERDATIARLHDLVAKFQRGGASTLYAEGHTDG